MNSCRKGKAGERELARYLSGQGHPARRGQQYCGGSESPDVVCQSLPGMHFEVKRVEKLRIHEAMQQAVDDAGEKVPVVAHRRNRGQWLAIMRMSDLLALVNGGAD